MAGLTHSPTWIPLSYSVFQNFQPVIKRWIKTSKSKISHTEASIRNLFLKIFYISAAEKAISPDYLSFLNKEFVKKYSLSLSQFPKQVAQFPDLFDSVHNTKDEQIVNFYMMLIHRIFKWISQKLGVGINGELKSLYTIPYLKIYELKMLVNMSYNVFSLNKESHLRYGGIPALFIEFLSHLCQNEKKTLGKKYSARKLSGSVFTPLWIIQMIRDRIFSLVVPKDQQEYKISDISVGYGGFLDSFLEKNMSKSKLHLYGFDADPNKIDIVKLNHSLLRILNYSALEINHLQIQDSMINVLERKFDILVGNPPWGARMNKSKLRKIKELSQFTVKQFDSYGLFLIRNIALLKENGLLYIVLPETLLLNSNYKEIRDHILKNTTIVDIIYLGENIFEHVNMPAIILGLRNTTEIANNKVNIFLKVDNSTDLKDVDEKDTSQYLQRNQYEFSENEGFIFDIFTNSEDRKMVEKIESKDCYRLRDLVKNSRGVEIGKKGEVIQCYNCGVWSPTPIWSLDPKKASKFTTCSVCKHKIFLNRLQKRDNIILDFEPKHLPSEEYTKFLTGENVQQYCFNGNKYLILHRRGIKYKSAKLYNQEKILIRKTSRDLVASIDYEKSYTIQVVYQFSLKESFKSNKFLLEFLLGIIQSRIIQFYYAKKYQYTYRKSFPHHLQKNILNLPIPKIAFGTKNTFSSLLYSKIVFSAMILMHLSHFKMNQDRLSPLTKKISTFIAQNPSILDIVDVTPDLKSEIDFITGKSPENGIFAENLQKSIEKFQKILDTAVERLFLSLE